MARHETRYYVAHGDIVPVEVRRAERPDGRVVWRERGGAHVYADRHICAYDDLTTRQKRRAEEEPIRREYEATIRNIALSIAKDPSLPECAGNGKRRRKRSGTML